MSGILSGPLGVNDYLFQNMPTRGREIKLKERSDEEKKDPGKKPENTILGVAGGNGVAGMTPSMVSANYQYAFTVLYSHPGRDDTIDNFLNKCSPPLGGQYGLEEKSEPRISRTLDDGDNVKLAFTGRFISHSNIFLAVNRPYQAGFNNDYFTCGLSVNIPNDRSFTGIMLEKRGVGVILKDGWAEDCNIQKVSFIANIGIKDLSVGGILSTYAGKGYQYQSDLPIYSIVDFYRKEFTATLETHKIPFTNIPISLGFAVNNNKKLGVSIDGGFWNISYNTLSRTPIIKSQFGFAVI